jgi:tetratricopeptide (TPR) repeat protein
MRIVFGLLIAAFFLCHAGCSGDAGNPDLRLSAEQALADGRAAFDQGQYELAHQHLGEAIKGGLNADLYSDALVHHAVAAIHLGRFDEALADFERLDQGATNMDQVYAAKSFLALKQGNKTEANRLWQQAVQANPKVKKFSP